MKKLLTLLALTVAFTGSVQASDAVTEAYLKGAEPKLNKQEAKAVELARQWRSSDDASKPIIGENGSVTYYYGSSQPVMICAPLEVCVIKLEPGEVIKALQAGDNVRWIVTPVVTGSANGLPQTEVIVKPTETGLLSSLYVGTDRRSYHIKLKSSRTKFIPFMGFHYPQDFNQTYAKYAEMAQVQQERETLPIEREHIENLDFEYKVSGTAPWKPVRVYNNGVRTIIQMPEDTAYSEAPVLLVLDNHGKETMVNSRMKNGRFIVDQVFKDAVLIAGVGKKQERIKISRL